MKKILVLLVAGLLALGVAAQQPYPNKSIRLVVGYGAGGATDVLARLVAQQISKQTGQPVVVENKPGAASLIANSYVAKSPPDGYTLLLADTSFAMVPATRKTMPYDTLKDFTPVAHIGSMPVVVVVPPTLGVNSIEQLLALTNSRRIAYSSGGPGTVFHLLAELMRASTGIKADHIPYKGGSEAINALVGGQVQFALASVSTALPFIKAGRLNALAVITSAGRNAALPTVPTMTELGFQNLAMTQWFGVLAPPGTGADVVRRMQAELQKAMEAQELQGPLTAQGWALGVSSPEDLGKLIASDLGRWKGAATVADLKPE